MTVVSDERLKILQMLEEGKITAEEAAGLLRSLEAGERPPAPGPGEGARYLRIRVTDLVSGEGKVNVTIPLGLVRMGLRIAEWFAPEFEDLDLRELEELIVSSGLGKIMEVEDAEDEERVEIYVE